MARKPPSDNGIRDSMRVHHPGAYAYVLDAVVCEMIYCADDWLTASADPISLLEYETRQAERKAELMRERSGRAVRCRSSQLPARLSSPFERFPRGGPCQFLVYPSDEIVLQPR